MQQKVHETVLEINLTALIDNFNYFKSKISKQTKIMAMVKAFSYGSGSFEIANILQYHQADYLAVAYADEGVELRKAGITLPIMVMNPEEFAFDLMLKYQLEPEIFSFRTLKMLVVTNKTALPLTSSSVAFFSFIILGKGSENNKSKNYKNYLQAINEKNNVFLVNFVARLYFFQNSNCKMFDSVNFFVRKFKASVFIRFTETLFS